MIVHLFQSELVSRSIQFVVQLFEDKDVVVFKHKIHIVAFPDKDFRSFVVLERNRGSPAIRRIEAPRDQVVLLVCGLSFVF